MSEQIAQNNVRSIYEAVHAEVVGRERELGSILAALSAGRDLLLEGPPGTSKSTILRTITEHYGIPLVFVEGNADLTPAKLIGYHNPAQVVRHGYRAEDFVPGLSRRPCARAASSTSRSSTASRRTRSTPC